MPELVYTPFLKSRIHNCNLTSVEQLKVSPSGVKHFSIWIGHQMTPLGYMNSIGFSFPKFNHGPIKNYSFLHAIRNQLNNNK